MNQGPRLVREAKTGISTGGKVSVRAQVFTLHSECYLSALSGAGVGAEKNGVGHVSRIIYTQSTARMEKAPRLPFVLLSLKMC